MSSLVLLLVFWFCAVPVDGSGDVVIVAASRRHGLFTVGGHETDYQWFREGNR